MRTRAIWFSAALSLLMALAACSPSATPTPAYPTATPTRTPIYDVDAAKAELAAARLLWESRGSDKYRIDFDALPGEGNWGAFRLTVRNGVIESATTLRLDEGSYGSGARFGVRVSLDEVFVATVEEIFEAIERALSDDWNGPAYELHAEYDPN